jgi:hypothetical protein
MFATSWDSNVSDRTLATLQFASPARRSRRGLACGAREGTCQRRFTFLQLPLVDVTGKTHAGSEAMAAWAPLAVLHDLGRQHWISFAGGDTVR